MGAHRGEDVVSREELIRKRAQALWEDDGRPPGHDQEYWDKAVQQIEAEGSEATRGPIRPDPAVGDESAPTIRDDPTSKDGADKP